jgi:hypothetical protein
MNHKKPWQQLGQYEPESWRGEWTADDEIKFRPNAREQTKCLELLGKVNYRIIHGASVYVEVGGVVYKTLYGGYWRSVFTGIEHYLLRCEQVSGSIWAEESCTAGAVDLPVAYSNEAWSASGHSLSLLLSSEQTATGLTSRLLRSVHLDHNRLRHWRRCLGR